MIHQKETKNEKEDDTKEKVSAMGCIFFLFSQAISRCVFGSMLAKAGDSRAKRRHTSSGCRYLALPSVLLAALMALPHPFSSARPGPGRVYVLILRVPAPPYVELIN